MTNKKSQTTKKALILSLITMLFSVAMLAGSTYAWFSYSVSSTATFKGASLNAALLKWDDTQKAYVSVGNGNELVPVEETIEWEPNKTQIIYLAVENLGSVGVKYDVNLTVTSGGGLEDAIEYIVVENVQPADNKVLTWSELAKDPESSILSTSVNTNNRVKLFSEATLLGKTENAEAECRNYFALVIHMKQEIGENASYMGKSITFYIKVNAVQNSGELDGLGNAYDANAPIPDEKPFNLSKDGMVKLNAAIEKNKSTAVRFVLRSEYKDNELFVNTEPSTKVGDYIDVFHIGTETYVMFDDSSSYGYIGITDKSVLDFSGHKTLQTVDLSAVDTTGITDMSEIFSGCTSLETVTFGKHFDSSYVTNMSGMFDGCSKLQTIDLTAFDTSNVRDMSNMFRGCAKLTKIVNLESLSTTKTVNTENMFEGCVKLVANTSKFTVDNSSQTNVNTADNSKANTNN